MRGEGSCGGGGAPRDSAGSGATEEGLTSRGKYLGAQLLDFVRRLCFTLGTTAQCLLWGPRGAGWGSVLSARTSVKIQ